MPFAFHCSTLTLVLLFATTLTTTPGRAAAIDIAAPGAWVDSVPCVTDSSQTYALYLPSRYSETRSWPALLVFDPRGRSRSAGERFQRAAETFGWIILSSNDTRSDTTWDPNAKALEALWPEVHQRYAIDPQRIYAAGFSGGAIVAWYLAQFANPPTLAGILSSGGRPANEIPVDSIHFAHFGTAGVFDFNHAPMKALDRMAAERGADHQLQFFAGAHQWMPEELAFEGIEWMELLAMRDGTRPLDATLRDTAYGRILHQADSLAAHDQPLAALRRYECLRSTWRGLRDLRAVDKRIERLSQSDALARQRDEELQADAWELQRQQDLLDVLDALQDGRNTHTWEDLVEVCDVSGLQERASERTFAGDAAQRVLEWIFTRTAFYIPRDLRMQNNARQAAVSLRVAAAIHPQRPMLWYQLACAHAVAGELRQANAALRIACDNGFDNIDLLQRDTDLAVLRGTRDFRDVLAGLARAPE